MATATPYLDAIQAIPGNTPGEKFRLMAKFIREKLSVSNKLEDVVESDKIPGMLVPLVQIQAAITLNKKDPKNESAYAAIAEALKSEDEIVVNRAFHASSFFNGTNKSITNIQYFSDNIFPHVSLNTRARIIKKLAIGLSSKKNTDLAEEFFSGVEKLYGVQQAMPLLLACSESFAYNTIVEKKIVLSRLLVRQIFHKNPDLIVRYFKLGSPNADPLSRNINLHPVNIYEFGDLLAQLVKKRLDSFVELCEIYEKVPPTVMLNNKMAQLFLKNGRKYLYEKPQLFIRMLPLKKISNQCMETIFPKLFPENIKDCRVDDMLKYLQYYREDKKADLFLKSYQQVYGKNILDETTKISVKLLKILPVKERIRQATIKLNIELNRSIVVNHNCSNNDSYIICWNCYLPVEESLPLLKEEITKESDMRCRAMVACSMIYCCHVNGDNQALLEVLTYLKNRHSNEQAWFMTQVFQALLNFYDLPRMDDEFWVILRKMIASAHMRRTLTFDTKVGVAIVEAAIHHSIIRNKNIDLLIDTLVDLWSTRKITHWNILQKYPQYEKMCLEACINVVSHKYDSNQTPWKEDGVGILYDLCSSIYHFNKSHANKYSRVKSMTIADYPWLLSTVDSILSKGKQSNVYIRQNLQNLLMKNDLKLYDRFWPDDKKVKILTGEVLKTLRRNPNEILANWKDYLKTCKHHWHKHHTKVFISILRWYKEIPIRFAKQCIQDLSKTNEAICIDILAILVHGDTFEKIVKPLIPMSRIDVDQEDSTVNYALVQHIISGIRLSNPPVSLPVLSKLCNWDSLSAISAFINVCRRTSATKVASFAKILSTQRVSIRKHGIRLLYLVGSQEYILNFLDMQWKSEQHPSIRKILFFLIMKFFRVEPKPATWSLFSHAISTFTIKDEELFPHLLLMIISIPDEYAADYIKQLLDTINMFEKANLSSKQVADYTSNLLGRINAGICNLLPDDFVKSLIRKYLFHEDINISRSSSMFVVTALLFSVPQNKFNDRLEIFSDVFKDIVTSGWNMPHPKYPRFYPVNNAFRRFVNIVVNMLAFMKMDSRLIDGLLSTFVSILEPQMDPTSYLELVYCKEEMSSTTPREFGSNLGKRIDELIEIFSPFYVSFMADILTTMPLSDFFSREKDKDNDKDRDNIYFAIAEGLLEAGSIPAALMAAKLFNFVKPYRQPKRYDELMMKFSEYDSPAVKSIVCDILNNTNQMDYDAL